MRKSYKIDNASIGLRLDKYIKNNIGKLPQSLIEKALRKGNIKLNRKKVKSSTKLKLNDELSLYNFNYKPNNKKDKRKFQPSNKVIKENEKLIIDNNQDFLVVNKDAGIAVQGGTKSKKNLIDIFSKSELFIDTKPYSVHRLDKDTSGVLLIAKNREMAKLLTSLFRLRKIHKIYLAICEGEINKNSGLLENDLIRYEGKRKIIEKAKTYYKILDKNSNFSLLELNPITGRKHQLRKQLFEIGHPICGDNKYFSKIPNKNLMLHAYQIKFIIKDKKFTYRALLPNYFVNFIKNKRLTFLKN